MYTASYVPQSQATPGSSQHSPRGDGDQRQGVE